MYQLCYHSYDTIDYYTRFKTLFFLYIYTVPLFLISECRPCKYSKLVESLCRGDFGKCVRWLQCMVKVSFGQVTAGKNEGREKLL